MGGRADPCDPTPLRTSLNSNPRLFYTTVILVKKVVDQTSEQVSTFVINFPFPPAPSSLFSHLSDLLKPTSTTFQVHPFYSIFKLNHFQTIHTIITWAFCLKLSTFLPSDFFEILSFSWRKKSTKLQSRSVLSPNSSLSLPPLLPFFLISQIS